MSLLRWNAKRDAGEPAIIEALEKAGCLVERLSGRGVADLLVCVKPHSMNRIHVRLVLLEVKERKGRLTAAQQEKIRKGWPVMVARSPLQALAAVGMIQEGL